jgi:hypothetical protein
MGFETRFAPGLLIIFASLLLVGLIVWSIAPSMPRKTQAGADTAAQWRAFKRYLAAIEQYAELPKAQELFDRYLPYAIAFGIEQSWVRAFARAAAPSPAWYGPVNTGRLLRAGGRVLGAPGGVGNTGGVPSLPGSGLQGASDALANSLQQTSDSLFAMFNAAGESFSLEPPGKSAPLTGAGAGFRFASVLLKAASGGGGGGFR